MGEATQSDAVEKVVRMVERVANARISLEAKRDALVKIGSEQDLDMQLHQSYLRFIDFLSAFEAFLLSESQQEMETLEKTIDIKHEVAMKTAKELLPTAKRPQIEEVFRLLDSTFRPTEAPSAVAK